MALIAFLICFNLVLNFLILSWTFFKELLSAYVIIHSWLIIDSAFILLEWSIVNNFRTKSLAD